MRARLQTLHRIALSGRHWRWFAALALIAGCHGEIQTEGDPGDGPVLPGEKARGGHSPGGDSDDDSPTGTDDESGQKPGDPSSGSPAVDCDQAVLAAGPSQLRRLQPDEYANTARELMDDEELSP